MLTKPQIESEQMKDLKYDLKIEKGIIIYTASTMEEQRDIAEYINSIDGEDYEIVDFSQKETHPMKKSIHTDSPKVIITNMQEVGFAPYCKSDNKATVTLDDKIEWCNRKIHDELRRNEGTILQSINLLRDSFFRDRKVICGMHPNFLDKMEYRPYFDYIDDWLDYVIDKVKFNESPEFTQSLPLSTRSNNSNEIQAGDMVFVFKNRVVCCPDFYSFKKYTEAERIEKLSQLPEISFPLKMRNVLVIAGPGGKAFGNEEINLLTSNIEQDDSRRMLCVGNGVEKIENEEIASKLEEISQNGDDTTIIIEMHGTEKDGQFYFINDDSYISSRELFEMVDSRFKDKPVDIVITSCHSGACLKDKDLLPKGSVVGALSQGNKTTASSDVKNFTENLLGTTDEFTTYNLVKLYLCGLKNRIPPEIGISGEQGTLQLDELLRNSIGKKIDKSKVINLLKETISAEEIEELINKIETSRNEYDICAAEYGKAIAVCATNEFGKDINHENYKSMEKNSRTMSLSTAYGFLETMDRYSTPIRRQSALNWSRRIIENSKDMDKGKEME